MNVKVILLLLLIGLLGYGAVSGGYVTLSIPSLPAVATNSGQNSTPTQNPVTAIAEMTLTPGSGGAGQLETAIPTKTIITDMSSVEEMRKLLQQNTAPEFTDWLLVGRLATGGGAHDCLTAWTDKPFDDYEVKADHLGQPWWKVYDLGLIITGQSLGLGGCQSTVMKADMEAGIPASYLKNPDTFQMSTQQYTYETDSAVVTASRVIVTVTVPWGYHGLVVQPGNQVTLQSVVPNENAAHLVDAAKWFTSGGKSAAYIWTQYIATENAADNLAILDTIAPILDWRTGKRSTDHLDQLAQLAQLAVTPSHDAYETIRKVVCESAAEAGFKDIPAQLPDGTPATLKACEVHINLVGPNPNEPGTVYHLDSIPPVFPAQGDSAGWSSYTASLRPVINQAEFDAYNFDNAYVAFQPDLQQSNWLSRIPSYLRQWAP